MINVKLFQRKDCFLYSLRNDEPHLRIAFGREAGDIVEIRSLLEVPVEYHNEIPISDNTIFDLELTIEQFFNPHYIYGGEIMTRAEAAHAWTRISLAIRDIIETEDFNAITFDEAATRYGGNIKYVKELCERLIQTSGIDFLRGLK